MAKQLRIDTKKAIKLELGCIVYEKAELVIDGERITAKVIIIPDHALATYKIPEDE